MNALKKMPQWHVFTATALLSIALIINGCGEETTPTGSGATDTAGATSDTTDAGAGNDAVSATSDAKTPEDTASVCPKGVIAPIGTGFFKDISASSGIRVDNVVHGSAKPIPINDHSRLGFVDIDGDGRDDIVCHSLFPNATKGIPLEHLIYRNKGDGTFEHISDKTNLRKVQAGFLAFGDVDNDGDQDCFAGLDVLMNGATHQILLNDGNGVFTKKSNSGVEVVPNVAANAVFADFNGDAKLDLFIGMGHTSYKSPNRLLFGNGDGTFTDKSSQLKDNKSQPTNGSFSCDLDNDGDLDIVVSNYGVSVASGHNALYLNDGKGNFTNVASEAGFAFLKTGNYWLIQNGTLKTDEPKPKAAGYIGSNGFGSDCGDVNGDGRMDIFHTAISHPNAGNYSRTWSDPSQLLINKEASGGSLNFKLENEFVLRKLPFNEGDVDGAMVDFDNDGRLDLSISRDKKYEGNYTGIDQKAWFGLMHQQQDGTFASIGPDSGINATKNTPSASHELCTNDSTCKAPEKCLAKRCRNPCTKDADCKAAHEICHTGGFCKDLLAMKSAQNHGWADIDHDGDLDLLVGGRDTGGGRPNFLFRNDLGNKLPWLQLFFVGDGKKVNRDAIGTRVQLVVAGASGQTREVKSSRGMHNSMDTRWQHFGLGDSGCDYTVAVTWPDGAKASFKATQLGPNKRFTIAYPDKLSAGYANP